MSQRTGRPVLAASALGYPLTQLVIRRFGQRGAVVVETVSVGLLARDLAMIASGTPSRLRRGPAFLLWLEATTAAFAAAAGLLPALTDGAYLQATVRRPTRAEIARRVALGALFGLHTTRFWIYLQPNHGRRPPTGRTP
jgi:hypothetical protein